MLHLTTIGVARTVPDGLQPKRLALLAYLALARPRGAQRRDTLVGLLWPELDQQRARAALRQAVHGMRKRAGHGVIVSTGTELLALSRELVHCDAWDLERAVEAADHERVLSLYCGELLAGLHLTGAPGFEEWRESENRLIRSIAIASAWAAATAAIDRGLVAHGAGLARRAITMDPLDEDGVRRAMRLLATAGDRAGALAEFRRFRDRLMTDLDIEPSAETRALAVQLSVDAGGAPLRLQSVPLRPEPTAPRRARGTERWRLGAAGAIAAIGLVSAALLASVAESPADPRRVEIGAVVNESGDAALENLAWRATQEMRTRVAALQDVAVVAAEPHAARTAGTAVRAWLRADGDSIELRAEVVNRTAGSVERTAVVRFGRHDLSAVAPRFAERVQTAIATALYPGWGTAMSQPASYASYQWFVTGMNAIKREEHDRALAAFTRAFDGDSAFVSAGLMAAAELMKLRRFQAADSLTRILSVRGTARGVDAALLDWLERSLRGDRHGAGAAMLRLTSIAPDAELAWLQLAIDRLRTGRPEQALDALDRITGIEHDAEGWVALWATRIEALHALGRHHRELDVVRRGLAAHPHLRVLAVYELRALAALGRTADVAHLIGLFPNGDVGGVSLAVAVRQAALELRAHGHDDAMLRAYMDPDTIAAPLRRAMVLSMRGEFRPALAIYDSVRRAVPACADCVGISGVLAARLGDRSAAQQRSADLTRLGDTTRTGPHPARARDLLWQARIANALGMRGAASRYLVDAFGAGLPLDAMLHADPDVAGINPDSLYRAYARSGRLQWP
ncbi:MAG: BTAD domain-containing putative transcriptional regulator [Gemmatimonadaceae bacterium]